MSEVIELDAFLRQLFLRPGVGFICAVPMGVGFRSFWRTNCPSIRFDIINFLKNQKPVDCVVYVNLSKAPDDLVLDAVLQWARKECYIFYSQRSKKSIFSRWGYEMSPWHYFKIENPLPICI